MYISLIVWLNRLNLHNWQKVLEPVIILSDMKYMEINVREYRRDNQKWTIQRNREHRTDKTKTNKTKTQHNTEKPGTQDRQDEDKQNKNTTQYVLTPLCASKHKTVAYVFNAIICCNSTICGRGIV